MDELKADVQEISETSKDNELSIKQKKDVIENICQRLKVVAVDVDKVLRAKELLSSLQRRKAFIDLIGQDDDGSLHKNPEDLKRLTSIHSLKIMSYVPGVDSFSDDLQMYESISEDICQMPFDEERWGNFFAGYQILNVPETLNTNENGKCIELGCGKCDENLYMYLREYIG